MLMNLWSLSSFITHPQSALAVKCPQESQLQISDAPPPFESVTYADEHLRERSSRILCHVDWWDHPVPLLSPQTLGAVRAGPGEPDDKRWRLERLLPFLPLSRFVLFLHDL